MGVRKPQPVIFIKDHKENVTATAREFQGVGIRMERERVLGIIQRALPAHVPQDCPTSPCCAGKTLEALMEQIRTG